MKKQQAPTLTPMERVTEANRRADAIVRAALIGTNDPSCVFAYGLPGMVCHPEYIEPGDARHQLTGVPCVGTHCYKIQIMVRVGEEKPLLAEIAINWVFGNAKNATNAAFAESAESGILPYYASSTGWSVYVCVRNLNYPSRFGIFGKCWKYESTVSAKTLGDLFAEIRTDLQTIAGSVHKSKIEAEQRRRRRKATIASFTEILPNLKYPSGDWRIRNSTTGVIIETTGVVNTSRETTMPIVRMQYADETRSESEITEIILTVPDSEIGAVLTMLNQYIGNNRHKWEPPTTTPAPRAIPATHSIRVWIRPETRLNEDWFMGVLDDFAEYGAICEISGVTLRESTYHAWRITPATLGEFRGEWFDKHLTIDNPAQPTGEGK